MADHHEKSDRTNTRRDPAESKKSVNKAESSKSQSDVDNDWGDENSKGGMSIEAKMGMCIVVILVSVFGFLVYRKFDAKQRDLLQANLQAAEQALPVSASANDDPYAEFQPEAQIASPFSGTETTRSLTLNQEAAPLNSDGAALQNPEPQNPFGSNFAFQDEDSAPIKSADSPAFDANLSEDSAFDNLVAAANTESESGVGNAVAGPRDFDAFPAFDSETGAAAETSPEIPAASLVTNSLDGPPDFEMTEDQSLAQNLDSSAAPVDSNVPPFLDFGEPDLSEEKQIAAIDQVTESDSIATSLSLDDPIFGGPSETTTVTESVTDSDAPTFDTFPADFDAATDQTALPIAAAGSPEPNSTEQTLADDDAVEPWPDDQLLAAVTPNSQNSTQNFEADLGFDSPFTGTPSAPPSQQMTNSNSERPDSFASDEPPAFADFEPRRLRDSQVDTSQPEAFGQNTAAVKQNHFPPGFAESSQPVDSPNDRALTSNQPRQSTPITMNQLEPIATKGHRPSIDPASILGEMDSEKISTATTAPSTATDDREWNSLQPDEFHNNDQSQFDSQNQTAANGQPFAAHRRMRLPQLPDVTSDAEGVPFPSPIQNVSSIQDPDGIYTVKDDDTYWTISKSVYGTARFFSSLALYNQKRIKDPRRLRSGMKVVIPDPQVLIKRYPELLQDYVPKERKPSGYFLKPNGAPAYRIAERETLSEISQKHLGRASRWVQLYRMNQQVLSNPNRLKPGTVINLPDDATNVHILP